MTRKRLETLKRWVKAKEDRIRRASREPASAGGTPVRFESGVFVMSPDPAVTISDRPFDLEGSSLLFTRIDAKTFTVAKTPLQYDANPGALFRTFSRALPPEGSHLLTGFEFPFFEESHRTLVISALRGISFAAPPYNGISQYGPLEAVSQQVPLIAPLLQTLLGPTPFPSVYLKEENESVTITWRSQAAGFFEYDIQAVLSKSGNILFSYRSTKNVSWGAVVVTSGKEAWYGSRTELFSGNDALGDLAPDAPESLKGMLDIESVAVQRIGGSDLLEFRLTLREEINRAALPQEGIAYGVLLQDPRLPLNENVNILLLLVYPASHLYFLPGQDGQYTSPAVKFEGRTLALRVLDTMFALPPDPMQMLVVSESDTFTGSLALTPGAERVGLDLGSFQSPTAVAKPIFEVFTLPSLNPDGVWQRLKAEQGFSDGDVDAVAIYQGFLTDLVFFAEAYSTVGNSGDDGVVSDPSFRYGSQYPRSPALLHMNTVGFRENSSARGRMHLVSHEIGHRWLYFLQILEDGQGTNVLNPAGGHPAQYVSTPSAFTVFGGPESSVMGGGRFEDLGNGTFRSHSEIAYYGYSWHELYLMGLARPEEIESWFYIANSNPPLGLAYSPPPGVTVTGIRKNVVFQQLADAMGPRNPPYERSQKTFRVLFVLLERPEAPLGSAGIEDFSNSYRIAFESHFLAATGGRGRVFTTRPLSPAFSFSPSQPVAGSTVAFTDGSSDSPTSWNWAFGDGSTSTEQNPTHTYLAPGTYPVTLAARNALGTSSASRSITVGTPSSVCAPSLWNLCFNAARFAVSLLARDQRTERIGSGQAIPQNDLFGYFSIPPLTNNPANPEVFVKVLDGRPINGSFWVFYGGLTDLEYTLTVLDLATGRVKSYTKPAGSDSGGFDTSAFPALGSAVSAAATVAAAGFFSADCPSSATALCLNSAHSFSVTLSARDQRTERTGPGQAIPQNDLFGYFSIPALTNNPANPEVFVKVLDGRVINGKFWVFFGGLTDLEYTLTVTENDTGRVKTYRKDAGSARGGFDTEAF